MKVRPNAEIIVRAEVEIFRAQGLRALFLSRAPG